MIITILSKRDHAGSGYKMCEALTRHTDYDVQSYSGNYNNAYNHHRGLSLNEESLPVIQDRIDKSDIVHVKGDWPVENGWYEGLLLKGKTIVVSVSGSLVRKTSAGGLGKYKPSDYNGSVITAMTPDLCYRDLTDIWIPHPIDTDNIPVLWEQRSRPMLIHNPTNTKIKHSVFIMDVMQAVRRKINCDIDVFKGESYQRAMRRKQRATLFIDQAGVGFYGNSAIELMRHGIPVVAWISPQARKRAKGLLDKCPVLSWDKDVQYWSDNIVRVLQKDMGVLSRDSIRWCKKVHSYKAVSDKLASIYKQAING